MRKIQWLIIVVAIVGGLWWVANNDIRGRLTSAAIDPTAGITAQDLTIVTLLPRDAIPAIFDPQFMTASEADAWCDPDELVLGVEIEGEARAYSIPFLSGHEIVNDTVGGRKIAVTW